MKTHDEFSGWRDPVLQRRLAKYIALQCFRNSMQLQDLHEGVVPCSAAGDYSDVVVRSPYGEIPWRQVSRMNNEEMKLLMMDVVDRTYLLVRMLCDECDGPALLQALTAREPQPHWKEPMLPTRY